MAALEVLSKHPQLNNIPLGLTGISQAGWIVPIAAEKSSAAKFMVLWSGPVLKKLNIPGLWIFGTQDGSVPVDLSISRLNQLRQSHHQYNYVLFSGVGHNNMPETFATATDWILRIEK